MIVLVSGRGLGILSPQEFLCISALCTQTRVLSYCDDPYTDMDRREKRSDPRLSALTVYPENVLSSLVNLGEIFVGVVSILQNRSL